MERTSLTCLALVCCIAACSPREGDLSFEASGCEEGDCGRVELDELQEKLHICRYEVELAGLPHDTPFPVVVMKPFRDDTFCRWEGRTLRYAVQAEGECPSSQDFRSHLSVASRGPVTARLVGSAKAMSMHSKDVIAANQVTCSGVSTALDNNSNRTKADAAGLMDRTESFVLEGDVLQEFGVDWALAELRGLNGLPITTAFYSAQKVTVHWRPAEYPFAVNICAETRQRLIENGAIDKTATCIVER